ncbi:efflux RND transporter periplasmic adaptor subunit [Prosthecobacter vanneervenii]|uniref:Multidrug efflux pump subunit AcrA (Membrane-fusion protein) n=1 Tax=Prosthecobacter vanneervenii TaxID=48466 RepID=A0A7W7Y8F6_9BACT|nr:efflux RND transporter periplasmic adaptor subunit [Prosthecobacter vanneervenii]MBB5031170.1 multidrug efflux pump subunit AcrA (membrane-fusion protein) [Prosthecobacter vanneervenii]
MKTFFVTTLLFTSVLTIAAEDSKRAANTIVLDETGVKNLRIETVEVEEADFETTLFSLGRIQAIPGKIADLSSRIAGRIVDLRVAPGDTVKEGDEVVKIESRQPGDPPPTITLKAPISGLVTQVNQHPGAPIEPSNAVLEITDLTEVYAVARVPEHQAGQMKPGTRAHIKVAALPTEKFEGELLRFGTSADRQSGTIDAIFRLPNTGGQLRPEMRAEFSIVMSKRDNVVAVPRSALQGEGGNRFVYVKDFDLKNAFIKTPVTVGEINDRYVEIVSGLLPADEVVTRGAYSLSFAGASTVSLKEALDAAHGHEHAEDGSELTPEKRAEMDAKKNGGAHHDHEGHDHAEEASPFWKYTSGVLGLLLVISLLTRKSPPDDEHAQPKDTPTPKEVA